MAIGSKPAEQPTPPSWADNTSGSQPAATAAELDANGTAKQAVVDEHVSEALKVVGPAPSVSGFTMALRSLWNRAWKHAEDVLGMPIHEAKEKLDQLANKE